MTPETLKKAQLLNNLIWAFERDLESISEVLDDFDNYGSSIQFIRNKDDNKKSFGSKKFDFKGKLFPILVSIKEQAEVGLAKTRKDLEEL